MKTCATCNASHKNTVERVLRSIEPDDTDEAERLENLCAAVALALQPKREGTLL